jgi:L-asparaginase
MIEDPETGALLNFDFEHFRHYVPELKRFDYRIESYTFSPPIDSSDMEPKHWVKIAQVISDNYNLYDGFVVLHGTDTMAYTASALSFMLENLGKPVIITGAQLPIGKLRTDGKENLLTSIEIAAARNAEGVPMVPEVCIFFENRLMRGNRTTKINAEGFNAFRSFNFPSLADAGIRIKYDTKLIRRPVDGAPLRVHHLLDTSIFILTLFPGIQREYVDAVMQMPNLRALVIKTYGSGNAPQKPWLFEKLRQLDQRGVIIVNITQCSQGSVEMRRYATGLQLLQAGVVNGYDGTLEGTVTKLMFLLGQNLTKAEILQQLNTNIAGEITLSDENSIPN